MTKWCRGADAADPRAPPDSIARLADEREGVDRGQLDVRRGAQTAFQHCRHISAHRLHPAAASRPIVLAIKTTSKGTLLGPEGLTAVKASLGASPNRSKHDAAGQGGPAALHVVAGHIAVVASSRHGLVDAPPTKLNASPSEPFRRRGEFRRSYVRSQPKDRTQDSRS